MSHGFAKPKTIATLYNSPPDKVYTWLSNNSSIWRGIKTSVLKILEFHESFNFVNSSSYTVPSNLGAIV